MCNKAFQNYLMAILQHTPERKAQAEAILTKAGLPPHEAVIVEEAAFRATHACSLAVAKVLDDFPAHSFVQNAAVAHIIGTCANDLYDMFRRMTNISLVASLGAQAEAITMGEKSCDCVTCVATRELIEQIRIDE